PASVPTSVPTSVPSSVPASVPALVPTSVPTSVPSIDFELIAPVVETRRSARQHHTFQVFLCALIAQTTPTYFKEAIKDFELCKAMNDELRALEVNETWEMTTLPLDKKAIEYHWIFKTKLKANGSMDIKKARLVVNGNR
ncbi:retrovirus-related pol polyprotein from transposon TNT 1-94, partial [Tanacetum coccineum]